MASIGDLIMRVVANMKGFDTTVVKEATKTGDKAGTKMSQSMSKSLSKGNMGKGLLQGLGLGAGLGAIGAVSMAIGKLTDLMGDAVTAAIEEEQSIAKLDTALRANVDGYKGNTEAIEEVLAARMDLGFADDEQRDSLALLIAATKDSTQALKIQRVAMDLARLKGISLKEASEALVKVEAGQFRMLKSLGIQLPKNATATEALAAVTEVAAGQAEAFAETSGGKMLTAQIKVGEAMEKLGERLLPVVVAAAEGAAEAVETLALTFEGLGDVLDLISTRELPKTSEEAIHLADRLADIAESIPVFGTIFKTVAGNTIEDMKRIADNADYMKDAVKDDAIETGEAFTTIGEDSEEAGEDSEAAWQKALRALDDFRDAAIASAERLSDEVFDPIILANETLATAAEIAAEREIIASKKSTDEQKADAQDRIDTLTEKQAEQLIALAEMGQTNTEAFKTGMKNLKTYASETGGQSDETKKKVRALIKAINDIPKKKSLQIIIKTLQQSVGKGAQESDYAVGGRVAGPVGQPVAATIHGGEFVVPNPSSNVSGADLIAALVSGSGGAGGKTYNVSLPPTVSYQSPRDVVEAMRMLGERGYL